MRAQNKITPQNMIRFPRFIALVMLFAVTALSACGGGGGDVGQASVLPDSITITSFNGPSGGTVNQPTSLNVKVATTGNIGSNEISYVWEQTAGTTVISSSQGNGSYESTLTFTPAVPGDVTFKVTASARGKTASQSKSVPINPT